MTHKEEELSKVKRDLCDKIDKLKKLHGSLEKKIAKQALRDEMAMAALTGMLASGFGDTGGHDNRDTSDASKAAYKYADAMLEAREEKAE